MDGDLDVGRSSNFWCVSTLGSDNLGGDRTGCTSSRSTVICVICGCFIIPSLYWMLDSTSGLLSSVSKPRFSCCGVNRAFFLQTSHLLGGVVGFDGVGISRGGMVVFSGVSREIGTLLFFHFSFSLAISSNLLDLFQFLQNHRLIQFRHLPRRIHFWERRTHRRP